MSILDSDALFAQVVQRLRLASQDDRTFNAAQMHLINLPEIIASAGPDWPMLKDRIRASSVSFLCGCLDPADLVIPAGDGFVILFAQGDPVVLKARAEELRLLLLEFYLGEDGLKRLAVAVSHRRIHAGELRVMMAPPPPPANDHLGKDYVFAPYWSPRAQLVASYICMPVRESAEGPAFGYDAQFAEIGRNEHRDYCALDLALLDAVHTAAELQEQMQPRPVLGASVHVSTLQNRRARAAYLDRLAQIEDHHLPHVVIRVAEIEAGVPIVNLADWAGLLRSRGRRVLLDFHDSEDLPPDLSQVGVWGAGFEATHAHTRPARSRQFNRWTTALTAYHVKFVVGNLARAVDVALAAQAGAHFISAPAFWPVAAQPGGVIRATAPTHFAADSGERSA